MTSPRKSTAQRKNTQKLLSKQEAQRIALAKIAQGLGVREAMAAVSRGEEAYRTWKKTDPAFAAELAKIRAGLADLEETGTRPVPDFAEFCEELGQPLHAHQLRMQDAIEGREPRGMLTCFRYDRGADWEPADGQDIAGRVIVNLPPGHAKTTTFSINYCTWLIYKNPNIKIIVVCKDQGLAKQILGAVKFRLTSPVYREMHAKYGPDGGFRDPDTSWTQTEIYVQGKGDGEKDPTMQALGIGGRIYGARSDVIILDDAVTLANVSEYEKQANWLEQEVESRLDGAGLLALLGTRIASIDLYSHMRETQDADDELVFTYFAMPAILAEADGGPAGWQTLWPYRAAKPTEKEAHDRCFNWDCGNLPDECQCETPNIRTMAPKFTGARLSKIRRRPERFALVYQQQDVAEDTTFNPRAVEASVNSQRLPGPMRGHAPGVRAEGLDGLYLIGGLDPAPVGFTSMIVMGVDKVIQKRYILDGFNQRATLPSQQRDTIKRLTEMYGIHEWVIEANAYQKSITQDEDLLAFLRARGCKMSPHTTNINKYDADFGIQSMAQLFLTCGDPPSNAGGGQWKRTPEKALIELPSGRQNAWASQLVSQLVVWEPSGMKQNQKTDLVMALWFCEIAAKKALGIGRTHVTHLHNPYAATGRLRDRTVVNLADFRAEMQDRKAA